MFTDFEKIFFSIRTIQTKRGSVIAQSFLHGQTTIREKLKKEKKNSERL